MYSGKEYLFIMVCVVVSSLLVVTVASEFVALYTDAISKSLSIPH